MNPNPWAGIVYSPEKDEIFAIERHNQACTWSVFNSEEKFIIGTWIEYLEDYGYILIDKWKLEKEE